MTHEAADHVVLLADTRGRRVPFGPARPRQQAEDVARRLRAWGMNATALPGRVERGAFVPDANSELGVESLNQVVKAHA